MGNDIKTGIGYLIPASAIVGFILSLFAGNFSTAIFFSVSGILCWVLYCLLMDSELPENTDKFIILFGMMLSVGIFLQFGLELNKFGGYLVIEEGIIFGLLTLLFTVLAGILYQKSFADKTNTLSSKEKDWIKAAVEKIDKNETDPRIVVIKQSEEEKIEDDDDDEEDEDEHPHPMYMMPPEYYEDEEDDDEEDEDEEDE